MKDFTREEVVEALKAIRGGGGPEGNQKLEGSRAGRATGSLLQGVLRESRGGGGHKCPQCFAG